MIKTTPTERINNNKKLKFWPKNMEIFAYVRLISRSM